MKKLQENFLWLGFQNKNISDIGIKQIFCIMIKIAQFPSYLLSVIGWTRIGDALLQWHDIWRMEKTKKLK